jgi:hypothetical protein
MNEIRGKKVVIKVDGSVETNVEPATVDTTQQQALDF